MKKSMKRGKKSPSTKKRKPSVKSTESKPSGIPVPLQLSSFSYRNLPDEMKGRMIEIKPGMSSYYSVELGWRPSPIPLPSMVNSIENSKENSSQDGVMLLKSGTIWENSFEIDFEVPPIIKKF